MARPVSVEVYTAGHRVLGRVTPGATGLFSYLNMTTRSYVEIEGGHLSRLHQPGRMVARYNTLWLVKGEIVAILLSSKAEIGPSGVARGGYSRTVPHWVHMVLGGYELRGQVEALAKFDFGVFLFEGDRIFIPLYDAELTAILFPNVHADAPAMLFNRERVDTLALIPKEDVRRKGGESIGGLKKG